MSDGAGHTMRNCVLVSAVLALGFPTGLAYGVPLPPGGGPVILPGSNVGGLVIHDELIPFEIRNAGNLVLFRGVLQNRVARLDTTGKLAFGYLIRDTQPGIPGASPPVVTLATSDFADVSTDVDYDPTAIGTVAPRTAARSADGAVVTFNFDDPPLFPLQTSEFMEIRTDADCFVTGGLTRITLSSGDSVVLHTVQPVNDDSAPIGEIDAPAPFACACNPSDIKGSAYDPDGSFLDYTLEYSNNPGGPWNLIASSTTPVIAGVLGVWNTTGLSQGYYFVRLTVHNACDLTTVFTTVMFVDQGFDTIDVRSPVEGGIYGGQVCFDGTVTDYCFDSYTVEWKPGSGGSYEPVDPAHPVSNVQVINDPFAYWDTIATGAADGNNLVQVTGNDTCDHTETVTRRVIIDNTAPIATITSPVNCDCLGSGQIEIVGTAFDTNLAGWVLQYTGGGVNNWVTIAASNQNVVKDVLAIWNTNQLPPCCYTIRLLVADQALVNCITSHQTEFLVSLDIGQCTAPCYDGDHDGDVDLIDFQGFQEAFTGPHP